MRIYELAKKLGIKSEELVQHFKAAGLAVKSHMSSATDEMVALAEKSFGKKPAAKAKAAAKKGRATSAKAKVKAAPKSAPKAGPRTSPKAAPKKAKKAKGGTGEARVVKTRVSAPGKKSEAPGEGTKGGKTTGTAPRAGQARKPSKRHFKSPAKGERKRAKVKPTSQELQQKAVRESVRRTLAKLETTRKTKRRKEKPKVARPLTEKPLRVMEHMTAKQLAAVFEVEPEEIIKKCLDLGSAVNVNQKLEKDMIELLADEFGKHVEFESKYGELIPEVEEPVDPSKLKPRAPVVTVMGHVDHGKTSILDYIRKTNVVRGEAGGITQHIGAYEVDTSNGKITFIDTPGHEAFTSMRARGAGVTDIVVLVVAADDGVMPQTIEAISHAGAAKVPIVVAINKMDLPSAVPDNVKQQLADRGVVVEDYGGDVLCQPVSAKTGEGIDKLLEMINLQAELMELKSVDEGPARGVVIEVKKEEGRGILCTVLVKRGKLEHGDAFIVGSEYGKARALLDHQGKVIKEAGPSVPVLVLGCNGLPAAGDEFAVVGDEREARDISMRRKEVQKSRGTVTVKKLTLEELYSRIQKGELKELKLIVKADTNGSAEALSDSLLNLSTDEVSVNLIHSGVGFITESDVLLAASSNAIIIGFNVKASPKAEQLAEREHVEIRNYKVIYECIEEMKDSMLGLLEPEMVEKVLGRAEVRKVFKITKTGVIAGSMVIEGSITRNARARVIRDGEVVYEGKITSLKRFKDDVKDVQKDFECGIGVGFNDIREGDVIETFIVEQKSKLML